MRFRGPDVARGAYSVLPLHIGWSHGVATRQGRDTERREERASGSEGNRRWEMYHRKKVGACGSLDPINWPTIGTAA